MFNLIGWIQNNQLNQNYSIVLNIWLFFCISVLSLINKARMLTEPIGSIIISFYYSKIFWVGSNNQRNQYELNILIKWLIFMCKKFFYSKIWLIEDIVLSIAEAQPQFFTQNI